MKMNIKATGIELTPELFAYAEKRLSKVEKYLNISDPVMAVELGRVTQHHKQGDVFRAEVRISGGGADYYAAKEAHDLRVAIDEVEDEVISEVNKDKGRRLSMMRRGGRMMKDAMKGFPWVKFRRR
jgi:ribosomal subunit interface protein